VEILWTFRLGELTEIAVEEENCTMIRRGVTRFGGEGGGAFSAGEQPGFDELIKMPQGQKKLPGAVQFSFVNWKILNGFRALYNGRLISGRLTSLSTDNSIRKQWRKDSFEPFVRKTGNL